ncbi:MAG: hypothetical protein SFX73_29505 [Kofleriaceae bacterium]|nr:hypothetical protein [Kofleriaceae bacterium]
MTHRSLFVALLVTAGVAHAESPVKAQRLATDAKLPAGIKPSGKRVIAVWSYTGPKNSQGHLVLSSTTSSSKAGETRKLFAQLYTGAKPKQVRQVQDAVTNCKLDMTASFVDGSIAFDDVDGDDKVEASFAYDLGCDATERPTPRKLLVLEGAAKHIIRGNGRGKDLDGNPTGGDYKSEGFKGEDALATWANGRWAELLDTAAVNVDP